MEAKLGRKLTSMESDKIWNTGSFHGLEMIDMAIHYSQSIDALEAYLAALPDAILCPSVIQDAFDRQTPARDLDSAPAGTAEEVFRAPTPVLPRNQYMKDDYKDLMREADAA